MGKLLGNSQKDSNETIYGRLSPIIKMRQGVNGLSANIGSKGRSLFADVNLDIDREVKPDIVGTVLSLPFRKGCFDFVYFMEVIEHLPAGTEHLALSEIYRIIKREGILILSTPNNYRFYGLLDPPKHLIGHRHYKLEQILKLVENAGFQNYSFFTSGGIWEIIGNLWYCFFLFPLKKIFGCNGFTPYFLTKKATQEFRYIRGQGGSAIFIRARKT